MRSYGRASTRGNYGRMGSSVLPIAARAVRSLYNGYKNRRPNKAAQSRQKGEDQTPLYGSTFTSKVGYRSRRPNRKRVAIAKRSFSTFLRNSMRLQNPQNGQTSGQFVGGSALNLQGWQSLDILNGAALFQMVSGQLPAGSNRSQLRDFELNLKSFNCRYYITNTGSNSVMLDIYYVTPRRNITFKELRTAGLATNGNVLAFQFTDNFNNVPATTDTNADTKGDPPGNALGLGATPFLYENFTRIYKINRIRNVVLPPGGTFENRETVRMKRINLARMGEFLSQTELNGQPTGATDVNNFYFRGLSRMMLFRCRGFPDASNQATAGSLSYAWEETSCNKVIQTRPGSNATYPGIG